MTFRRSKFYTASKTMAVLRDLLKATPFVDISYIAIYMYIGVYVSHLFSPHFRYNPYADYLTSKLMML